MKNTVVVITGDHGESIWDDGTLTHGSRSSDIQTRAPALILGRGISPGVVKQATTHLDLFPTVLHLAAGEHVLVRGIHGRDILDPSSNAEAAQSGDPFLILPLVVNQPLDLVLVVDAEKMLFKARLDRNEVSAVGMIDQNGFLSGKSSPDGDQGIWFRAINLIADRFQSSH